MKFAPLSHHVNVLFVISCLLLILWPSQGQSVTPVCFVSDQLVVNLKNRAEPPFSTTTRVTTGDELTIIGNQGDSYKVRTTDGQEGWIERKYVSHEQPKERTIAALQKEIAALKADRVSNKHANGQDKRITLLHQRIAELADSVRQLKEEKALLTQKNESLNAQLNRFDSVEPHPSQGSITEQTINHIETLTVERDELAHKFATLSARYDRLNRSLKSGLQSSGTGGDDVFTSLSQRLDNDKKLMWFIAGALVFFFGMSMGLYSSRKRRRLLF